MRRVCKETSQVGKTNKPLAIFATLLIMGGMVGIAYVSSLRQKITEQTALHATTTSAVRKVAYQPMIALLNERSAVMVAPDGKSERITMADLGPKIQNRWLPIEGSNVATGAVAYFRQRGEKADASQGMRSPDGTFTATLAGTQETDASVILMTRKNDSPQRLVLRDHEMPLRDVSMVGWFSDRELMVTVTASTSRAVYAVSSATTARFVHTLPDNVSYLSGRNGSLWYVTSAQGEGVESPPRGPSEVHRLTTQGEDTVVARNDVHAITSVLPDAHATATRIAYTTDDGQAYFKTVEGTVQSLGKVRPLMFLPSGELIVRVLYDLLRINTDAQTREKLTSVPEGEVEIYDLAPLLDAKP